MRPAVSVGLSVSRVGGSAQVKAMKKVAGTLRLDLAQYRELQAFSQFGSDLDKDTQAKLTRGSRTMEILKQDQYEPMAVEKQVLSLYAAVKGFIDDVALSDVKRFEREMQAFFSEKHDDIMTAIRETKELSKETEEKLNEAIKSFKKTFVASN